MAQGVGQAIAENKLGDKIKVIGFDSDEKTVGFLKEGVLAGLVVQDPYRMGYDGVKTALAASKGEKVEANVDTGANLMTKANMADPKIEASEPEDQDQDGRPQVKRPPAAFASASDLLTAPAEAGFDPGGEPHDRTLRRQPSP